MKQAARPAAAAAEVLAHGRSGGVCFDEDSFTGRRRALKRLTAAANTQLGQIIISARNNVKKFVKSRDDTYICTSLTYF